MIGKEHKNVLRDIRRYTSELNQLNIEPVNFFSEIKYRDGKGEDRPCYLVTKKGCEFIAHKLTGVKGTEFTAKYINRFHDMESQLQAPVSYLEILKNATLEVSQRVDSVDNDLQNFKKDMPLLGIEESKVTAAVRKKGVHCLGGKDSEAYQDKSVRQKVYSDIYGQLKREFGVDTYKAIKRSQVGLAISIIEAYELPIVLEEEITDMNAQMVLQ
jgi:Rha family phage regulatory protein